MLWLAFLLSLSGPTVRVSTPEGEVTLTFEDVEVPENENEAEIAPEVVLRAMDRRLQALEGMVRYMSAPRRPRARQLLRELRAMVALLEENISSGTVVIRIEEPEEEASPAPQPLSGPELEGLIATLKKESFPDDRLRVLRTAAARSYFTVDQVLQILPVFSFEDDRLEAVRILWPRVLDRDQGHRIYEAFTFPDSKEELETILR